MRGHPHRHRVRDHADTKISPATLLDELAALDPAQRREVAAALRNVAETFAGVPDGRDVLTGASKGHVIERTLYTTRCGLGPCQSQPVRSVESSHSRRAIAGSRAVLRGFVTFGLPLCLQSP